MKRHAKSWIRSRKPIRGTSAANPKAQDNVDIKKDRFNPVAKALDYQQTSVIVLMGSFKRTRDILQSNPSLFRNLPTAQDLAASHNSMDERAKTAAAAIGRDLTRYQIFCDKSPKTGTPPHASLVGTLQKMGS